MKQSSVFPILVLVFLFSVSTLFQGTLSQQQEQVSDKRPNHRSSSRLTSPPSTAVLPVGGKVFPEGYFYAIAKIGQPPKTYHLDIDTGSDLTWVQCDAPCTKCLKAPHRPYKPGRNIVRCENPVCPFIQHPVNHPCQHQDDQCDYEIEYADHGVSIGILVNDHFSLKLTNGSSLHLPLIFGCGYDQDVPIESEAPFVDGVLGLANGRSGILSQLRDMRVINHVFGHCFSSQGGGYIFFGDDLVPMSGVYWVPMLQNLVGKYYTLGPAELHFGGQNALQKGLQLVFDSGSTFSYFNAKAYETVIAKVKENLESTELQDVPEDKTLPICWKGKRPIKSVVNVRKFFKPLTFQFTKANVKMEIQPEAYLLVSDKGNVCFGILDSSKADLGDLNLLGDNFMLDKMVIYDNEKQQIGWTSAACDKLPNVDRDHSKFFGGLFQSRASNSDISNILEEYDEL